MGLKTTKSEFYTFYGGFYIPKNWNMIMESEEK